MSEGAVGALHGRFVHGRRIRKLVEHLDALIPHGAAVLDVGCGDGLLAARLQEARPDLTVRGLDVLVRPTTHIPIDLFDGQTIPAAAASWDVVTCIDVLHHTDDPSSLLAECARVARSAVVVKDHLRNGWGAAATLRFMDRAGNARHGVRLPYNYLSYAEWQTALTALKLSPDVWEERLGLYPVPANWLFGRRLHFIARLVPRSHV
jgi:SAM-dependent methyltransferase